jgi:hypothetical protein
MIVCTSAIAVWGKIGFSKSELKPPSGIYAHSFSCGEEGRMMRRVVVTGMGIVSAIGNNTREVLNALRQGRSGIAFIPAMREFGYRCQVAGLVKEWQPLGIAERTLQTMSNRARYAASAALEALEDAQLTPDELHGGRVGISLGTGLGSANEAVRAELGLISWRSPTLFRRQPRGLVRGERPMLRGFFSVCYRG